MKNLGVKITSSILLLSTLAYATPVFAYTKDETVYSKLDTTGKVYQTTVSDHIKNTEKSELIKDMSDLMNIENVGGEQELTKENSNLTWKAGGNDIYYKGNTQKELPIDCKVTYYLNEEEVSKEDIVGKSGSVKVVFEFTNKEERRVTINGKVETMYVPFIVGLGTVIDNSNNKNIKVTNGKIIDNGTKSMVVGVAMPGLQESLGVSKSKVDIPNKVEISMEATDFTMQDIYCFATPKLVEESDINIFDKMGNIYSMANELKNGSNQLVDGSNQLNNGIKELSQGAQSLNEGAEQLSSGTEQLATGASQISSNMEQITNGTKSLLDGQKQVSAGLSQIKAKLPTEENNKENETKLKELKTTNSSTVTALTNANTQIKAQLTEIETKLEQANASKDAVTLKLNGNGTSDNPGVTNLLAAATAAYTEQNGNLTQVNTALNSLPTKAQAEAMTEDQVQSQTGMTKAALLAQIGQLEGQKAILTEVVPLLKNQKDALQGTSDALNGTLTSINGTITLLTSTQESLNTSLAANTNLIKLISGNNTVVDSSISTINSMRTLSGAVEELSSGSKQLEDGTNKLYYGSSKLQEGASKVATASKQVSEGSLKLTGGTTTLKEGTVKLAEGSQQLTDGINKFDAEGIQKIYNLVNGDVKDLEKRVEKLKELADEYNSFTMINDNAKGSVKFIMMIDSISKEDSKKEKAVIQENKQEQKEEKSDNKEN